MLFPAGNHFRFPYLGILLLSLCVPALLTSGELPRDIPVACGLELVRRLGLYPGERDRSDFDFLYPDPRQ